MIGESLFGAHSGMTAEGDNSVLMQKIVKDIMTDVRAKKHDNLQLSKEEIQALKSHKNLGSDF